MIQFLSKSHFQNLNLNLKSTEKCIGLGPVFKKALAKFSGINSRKFRGWGGVKCIMKHQGEAKLSFFFHFSMKLPKWGFFVKIRMDGDKNPSRDGRIL